MKKLFVLLALTVSMALFLSSCGDDDTATGPSSLKLGEMSATVNGSGWKAQNAIFFNTVRQFSGIQIDVSNPINGTKKTISVILGTLEEPTAKTYTAICFYQETTGIGMTGTTTTWNDAEGTCEVTEVTDKEIRGTFKFKGVNDEDRSTKTVSGSFNLPRQ